MNVFSAKGTEKDRQLLFKYLVKKIQKNGDSLEIAQKKAKLLMKKHQDNLFGFDSLAVKIGREYFDYFCLYFMQDTFIPKPTNKARELSSTHLEMWDEIQQMFVEDKWDMECFALPRGMGKTTVIDLALGTWLHCYKLSPFTVVGGKKDEDATNFIGNIKKQFEENTYIINAFGKIIERNNRDYIVNQNEIEFTNGTKIQAISSGGSARGLNFNGLRPTTFIGDDYQADVDVLTEQAREKKWNKWCDEIENFGDTAVYRDGVKVSNATKVICIGTVLHSQCLISRLLAAKEYRHMLRQAIILNEGETVEELFTEGLWGECKKIYFDNKREDGFSDAQQFYLDHKQEMDFPILWEDKWDRFKDLAVKYWKNPESFKKEMMNDALQLGQRKFKHIETEKAEDIENHSFKATMLCIDPAGSDNKDKKKKNYYAFVVGSISFNGFKYVRKGEIFKYNFEDYMKHTLKLLKDYPDITTIYIEKNTYNGSDVIRLKQLIMEDSELKHRRFNWINESQHRNKMDKIMTIVGEVNNAELIFNADDVEFTQQISVFTDCQNSAFDDAPDITAEFSNRIIDVYTPATVEIKNRKALLGI